MKIKNDSNIPQDAVNLGKNNTNYNEYENKKEKNDNKSKNFIVDLFNMIIDPKSAWISKILGIVSIVYLLLPADIVPDIVPVVGFLDDTAMFLMTIKVFMNQLKKYRLNK
jgi:uncharacterized membrane protein YkvA (DUF1232 family)